MPPLMGSINTILGLTLLLRELTLFLMLPMVLFRIFRREFLGKWERILVSYMMLT